MSSPFDIAQKYLDRATSKEAPAVEIAQPASIGSSPAADDAAPPCWNCGAVTTETRDIYGETVRVCDLCTVSSDVLPDLAGQMPRAWVVEEVRDKAVKICSAVLDDHLWLILDRSFIPHDGLACYYAEEIPLLGNKTPEDLREIHKAKLAFPGCRVIQERGERGS